MSRGGPAADPSPCDTGTGMAARPMGHAAREAGPTLLFGAKDTSVAKRTRTSSSTGAASYPGNSPRAVISQTTSAPSSISPITMLAAMPAARPRNRAPCPSGRR